MSNAELNEFIDSLDELNGEPVNPEEFNDIIQIEEIL